MDLGIADYGQCAGHKQEAQIAVASFADTAKPFLAPLSVASAPARSRLRNYVLIGTPARRQR